LGWGGWGWGGWGISAPLYGFGAGGFYPGWGVGYGGLFGPCSGATANVYTLNMGTVPLVLPQAGAPLPGGADLAPSRQLPSNGGTFPYDGGPQQVVPNPRDTPPSSTTPRTLPLEGRSVSLPKAAPKWSYPAYGETARRTIPASERTYLTRSDSKKTDSR
jgi:hypothetical protein